MSLHLDHNQLTGSISSDIGKLTALEVFSIYYNFLQGSIPSEISELTALTELSFNINKLAGSIPSAIGGLTGLTVLQLGGNQLTGSVPQEMLQLKKLTFFTLDTNHLTGKLPAFDFSQFTRCCAMFHDSFACPLPAGADKCLGGSSPGCAPIPVTCKGQPCTGPSSALIAEDCSVWQTFTRNPLYTKWAEGKCGANVHTDPCNCTFDGKVGCANSRITKLSMASQGLPGSGGIPSVLLDLTALTELDLDLNRLSGTIPSQLSKLVRLVELRLQNNDLIGTIPSQLAALMGLSLFDVNSNHLTGAVPTLPFKQFTGNCCLNSQRTNNFTCPLPAGAADCKCNGGAGLVDCGLPK
jgi:Leucine-rich repeat (LRR) protein